MTGIKPMVEVFPLGASKRGLRADDEQQGALPRRAEDVTGNIVQPSIGSVTPVVLLVADVLEENVRFGARAERIAEYLLA